MTERHSPHPNPLPMGEGTGVRDAIQSIYRSELKPYARSYAENLSAQVVRLLRDSDVKSVPEFEERCRQRLVPAPRVRKMQALLAQLNEIRKTGVAPALEDVHFEEHGSEGREIELDLQETLNESRDFFASHHLPELARALPNELRITPKNLERIRAAMRQGFDRAFFTPRTHVQLQENHDLVVTLMDAGRMLINPQSSFSIQNRAKTATPRHRPSGKAYVLMYQSGPIPEDTRGRKPGVTFENFKLHNWSGLTLQEYLAISLREREQRGDFSFSESSEEWLLASESVNLLPLARYDRFGYDIFADNVPSNARGARPTVIVEIE